jgi:hypothetical protein
MSQHSHEERVRLRAYEIWLNEGKPEGREQRHWEMAREIVGYEDAYQSTLVPVSGSAGEPVEPSLAFQSQGELPTLTDQGDSNSGPSRSPPTATAAAPKRAAAKRAAKPAEPGVGTGKETRKRTGGTPQRPI